MSNGNIAKLTHGRDKDGQICGVDAGVSHKPFVFYCAQSSSSRGVPSALDLASPVCIDRCPSGPDDSSPCGEPTYATVPILGTYCLPDLVKIAAAAKSSGELIPKGLRDSLLGPNSPINSGDMKFLAEVGGLRRCKWLIFGMLIFAIVMGVVFLQVIKCCAKPMVYCTIIFMLLLFLCTSLFFLIGESLPRPKPISDYRRLSESGRVMETTALDEHPIQTQMRHLTDLYGENIKFDWDAIFGEEMSAERHLLGIQSVAPSRRAQLEDPPLPAGGAAPAPGSVVPPLLVVPSTPAPAPPPLLPTAASVSCGGVNKASCAGCMDSTSPPSQDKCIAMCNGQCTCNAAFECILKAAAGGLAPAPQPTLPTLAPMPVSLPTFAPLPAPASAPPPAPVPTLPTLAPMSFNVGPSPSIQHEAQLPEPAPAPASSGNFLDELQARWNKYGNRKWYEKKNPFYTEKNTPAEAKKYSYITGAVFAFFTLLVFFFLCCAHQAIDNACKAMEVASDCLDSNLCTLVMPIIDAVVKISVFLLMLHFFAHLGSCGHLTNSSSGVFNYKVMEFNTKQKFFIGFFIFMWLWILEFCNALGQFVLSFTVVKWYFYKSDVTCGTCGLIWGWVYGMTFNAGSIAFGAFFMAICRAIKLFVDVLAKINEAGIAGNPVMKCLFCIFQLVCKCLVGVFQFFNKNVYTDIAITSRWYCPAAKEVVAFMSEHGADILILQGAMFVFTIAGVLTIGGSTGYLTYWLCNSFTRWTDQASPHYVNSPRFVANVAACMGAFVGFGFMLVLDHIADAVLYVTIYNRKHAHNTLPSYKHANDKLCGMIGYKPQSEKAKEAAAEGGGGGFFRISDCMRRSPPEETKPLMGHH
jgi:hypothetical protein